MLINRSTYRFTFFVLAILLHCVSLSAQSDSFRLSIEYSPHFSQITDEFVMERPKLSHLFMARVEYPISKTFSPTIGLGFLSTGSQTKTDVRTVTPIDLRKINFVFRHNYLLLPVGLRMTTGKYFIHPELAIGYNLSNTTKQKLLYNTGETEITVRDQDPGSGSFNTLSFPALLSVGRVIELSDTQRQVLLGLKAYYGLNQLIRDVPRNAHYYGMGLTIGLQL